VCCRCGFVYSFFLTKVTVAKPHGAFYAAIKTLGKSIVARALVEVADASSDGVLQSQGEKLQGLAVALESANPMSTSFCDSAKLAAEALFEISSKGSRRYKHDNSLCITRSSDAIVTGSKQLLTECQQLLRRWLELLLPELPDLTEADQILEAVCTADLTEELEPLSGQLQDAVDIAKQFLEDVANPLCLALEGKYMQHTKGRDSRDALESVVIEKELWVSVIQHIKAQDLGTQHIVHIHRTFASLATCKLATSSYHRKCLCDVPQ